jgi:hypothetical protein
VIGCVELMSDYGMSTSMLVILDRTISRHDKQTKCIVDDPTQAKFPGTWSRSWRPQRLSAFGGVSSIMNNIHHDSSRFVNFQLSKYANLSSGPSRPKSDPHALRRRSHGLDAQPAAATLAIHDPPPPSLSTSCRIACGNRGCQRG